MSSGERTLDVAAEVTALLAERGAPCAVIGAVALAVREHGSDIAAVPTQPAPPGKAVIRPMLVTAPARGVVVM